MRTDDRFKESGQVRVTLLSHCYLGLTIIYITDSLGLLGHTLRFPTANSDLTPPRDQS